MTSAMNCRKMVSRVRQRIHDVGSRVYDDAEILSTADDVMREMFTQMRSAGQNWGIDRMDVALGAFAQQRPTCSSWSLASRSPTSS